MERISIGSDNGLSDWPSESGGGLDTPPGRTDCVVSAVTGRPLRYFTPDPLSDLLRRCAAGTDSDSQSISSTPLGMSLLAHMASRTGQIDAELFRIQAKIYFNRSRFHTTNDLVGLAGKICPRVKSIRSEIVFAGARTASDASIIFAPYDRLPSLMNSLATSFEQPLVRLPALTAAAITGYFCIHAHPFLDGNGRWGRVVALQSAVVRGAPCQGAIAASFLQSLKAELADCVWPNARSRGLRLYLDLAATFSTHLMARASKDPIVNAADSILKAMSKRAKSPRAYECAVTEMFLASRIYPEQLRRNLGLTKAQIFGLMSVIQKDVEEIGLRTEDFLNCLSNAIGAEMLHSKEYSWARINAYN